MSDTDNQTVQEADDSAKQAAREKMQAAMQAASEGKTEDNQSSEDLRHVELESDKDHRKGAVGADAPKGEKTLSHVKVYSPFHVYYDSDADSISAVNLTGPFDVLYGHKNFMSILSEGDVVVRSHRGEERIKIDRGVMHVRDNEVTVFLDI